MARLSRILIPLMVLLVVFATDSRSDRSDEVGILVGPMIHGEAGTITTGFSLTGNVTQPLSRSFGLRGDIRWMRFGPGTWRCCKDDAVGHDLPGIEPVKIIEIWGFQLSGVWTDRNLTWGDVYMLAGGGMHIIETNQDETRSGIVISSGCGAHFGKTRLRLCVEFAPQVLISISKSTLIIPLIPLNIGLSF